MRKVMVISIAFAAFAACGGGGSGLDSSVQANQLSESDKVTFCEWSIEEAGGPGHVTECGDDVTVTTNTVDECVEGFTSYAECDITVGELEDCANAISADPCSLGGAACAPLFECFQ